MNGRWFKLSMDRIETIVKSLRKCRSDLESTKFELVFSFPSDEMAQEYFRKTYHWEHHDSMIKYQLDDLFFSGFKIKTDLNAKNLMYLTKCYVDLAAETKGNLYRWKQWV